MTTISEKVLMTRRHNRTSKDAILLLLVLFSIGLIQLFTSPSPQNNSSCSQNSNRYYNCLSMQAASSSSPLSERLNQATNYDACHARYKYQNLCSSPRSKVSQQQQATTSLTAATSRLSQTWEKLSRYLSSTLVVPSYLRNLNPLASLRNFIASCGPRVISAEALSLYQPNQDKEIIVLSSANFNTELIQNKSPFPHIKLIEYYVSFCGFCTKFKTTYTHLAKEIYPWRNVIRPSAIDLGVSNNSPIAHSWSVEVVPMLKLHPPLNQTLAQRLDKSNSEWSKSLGPAKFHRKMFEEFEAAQLGTKTLESVAEYMDKVPRLKSDLLAYIEQYVAAKSSETPETWPNLRPVSETSLLELRKSHPRTELFLIIDATNRASESSSASSNLGLSVMLELSSSAAWKAIRYVRASENKVLIEDVINQLKKISERQQQQQQDKSQLTNTQTAEQIELLNNIMQDKQSNEDAINNIILIHIDDSHSPMRGRDSVASAIPSMTMLTGSDLVNMDSSTSNDLVKGQAGNRRARDLSSDQTSIERKIELVAAHVKQTYTETNEDRLFLGALNVFDDDVSLRGDENKLVKKFSSEAKKSSIDRTKSALTSTTSLPDSSSKLPAVFESLNPHKLLSQNDQNEYEDKLKAIHYILFNEVPSRLLGQKSLTEKQEKLNTLLNLVAVIKAYFPLPDSPSIQFIDGVQLYLNKQQERLLSAVQSSQDQPGGGSSESAASSSNNNQPLIDSKSFKNELKRLESDGKHLPEIKEWKYCSHGGYPCALWRLFHTLTAFEYKKLSQIYQVDNHSTLSQPQSLAKNLQQASNSASSSSDRNTFDHAGQPSQEQLRPQQGEQITSTVDGAITTANSSSSLIPTPIERLVSPPSTTTSLSLTIATPTSSEKANRNNKSITDITDLPMPVILVMRDYVSNFFRCEECVRNFRLEANNLSFERIRHQEPAEFSILWLWETHNSVNKRLSVDIETNPPDHPKVWFPTYEQCSECYNKPPSFLNDASVEPAAIFHESIEWNRQAVLCFLLKEFTKQPMDNVTNIFGYQVPYGFGYLIVTCLCCLILCALLRCASYYVERQRRHKATLLNGNAAHYTMELQ